MHAQNEGTKKARYFSRLEILLWGGSAALILLSFLLFDRENYLALCASLLGVTSLIYCAKLHPLGQMLMVLFSLLYGVISYSFSYFGEMITYLGMTRQSSDQHPFRHRQLHRRLSDLPPQPLLCPDLRRALRRFPAHAKGPPAPLQASGGRKGDSAPALFRRR